MLTATDTINNAARTLRAGGIVAMPTDTVYGLHCDPHCLPAIEKILMLKKRSYEKGLILIADSLERFHEYIQPLPDAIIQKIIENPGITWLVPARENISHLITGNFTTVAIRICQKPTIAQITQLLDSPLISTSANISHQPVAKNAQEIEKIFTTQLDLIIDGELSPNAKSSEIRDVFTDARIR